MLRHELADLAVHAYHAASYCDPSGTAEILDNLLARRLVSE